jgi:hypothetical protein
VINLTHLYHCPPQKPKESMPYPKWLVYNVFQSYEPLSIVVLKLSLPFNWVVLLFVVHRIKVCKHAWKAPLYINLELILYVHFHEVFSNTLAEICKYCMHKPFYAFHCDIIDKLAIFIYWISPSYVCKDLKCTCALLDRRLEVACVIIWFLQK